MKKNILFLLIFSISSFFSGNLFAQSENCGDGIDNDGDGFVDCYDGDCKGSVHCEDFFMGDEATCEAKPTDTPKFTIKKAWGSPDQTATSFARPSIGDVDGDGVPEIIVTNTEALSGADNLFILSGSDGSVLQSIKLGFKPEAGVTLGDVNGDGYAEFFVSGYDTKKIEAWTYDPVAKQFKNLWRKEVEPYKNNVKGTVQVLGLADFNEDGKAELYFTNEIWDAWTGTRLVNGFGEWGRDFSFAPVAVDILDKEECTHCDGLELVSGLTIYAVNIGNGTKDGGSLTKIKGVDDYKVKNISWNGDRRNWSGTSVADYNQDGSLDVIASGAYDNSSWDKNRTAVFVWDVKNNNVKRYLPPNNWARGTGRLNVADIDGDGNLNVTFVSGDKLFALDENFNIKWQKTIFEETSGVTGTSVFDFNGDGAYETVYRDERYLYIINGADGSEYRRIDCKSRTNTEYPIVVDIDGDGATEICVVCNTSESAAPWNDYSVTPYSQVRVYKSDGENWVPSRKVWNQHTYFNVNINDDLTIPRQQQKHHIEFEGGECTNGEKHRPLNTFLNQSPYLDIGGCPTYGAPDFTVLENSLKVKTPTCPDRTFNVSFMVRNDGDIGVSGDIPITFYDGDPELASGKKLNTEIRKVTDLKPGETITFEDLPVTGYGSSFTLFIAFNDAGTSTPPISLPNGGILECDYEENIISTSIQPKPFPIEVKKLRDNLKCEDVAKDNGSAEAFILDGTNKITTGHTFNWYKEGDFVFTGAVYTGMAEGIYTVVAVNDEAKCSSVERTVEINNDFSIIEGGIEVIQEVTKCNEANGTLSAHILKDGKKLYEEHGYTFDWYKAGNIFIEGSIISIGHKVTGLAPEPYSVVITEKASGCVDVQTYTLGANLTAPIVEVEVKNITSCLSPNGGVLEASVEGSTSGYTFKWYKGAAQKKTPDYEGIKFEDLAPGDYSVIAVNNATGCESVLVTKTVESIIAKPTVTFTPVDPTTCVGVTPNGSISLTISTPAPGSEPTNGYNIRWFRGTGASKVALSDLDDQATATALSAATYTILVTHPATNCVGEIYVPLEDKSKNPVLTAKAFKNTICDPTVTTDGYDGHIETEVKLDGVTINDFTDYTFEWYNVTTGTTLTSSTPGTLSNLKEGKYEVKVSSPWGCVSNTFPIEVKEDKAYPAVTAKVEALQTSCDDTNPNGKLSANVGGNTTDYTFEWFEGNGTGTPLSHGTVSGASVSGLKVGNYTVRATSTATGCSKTAPVSLGENINSPALTPTITKNTICDLDNDNGNLYDGKISLKVEFDEDEVTNFSNYSFTWYEGANTSGTLITSATSATLSNVKAGQYTVVVSHDDLDCTTEKTYTIGDGTSKPVVTVKQDALQTSCDSNNPNGALSANIGGNTSNYTFAWYEGDQNTISTTNAIGTSPALINKAKGIYTVVVTSKATGCVGIKEFNLREDVNKPSLALDGNVTHFENCSAADGEITVALTDAGPSTSGHTYTWYKGGVVDATKVIPGETGPSLSGLTPGEYTVVVTNNFTHCTSATFTAVVEDKTTPLVVLKDITNALECNDGTNPPTANTGEIEITSIDGIILPNSRFSFEWKSGSPTDPNATYYTDPAVAFHSDADNFAGDGKDSNHLKLVESQTYSVIITDHDTGCKTIRSYHVGFDGSEEFDLANTVIDHSTVCFDLNDPNAHGNGTITLQLELNNTPVDANDYIFRWYKGSNVDENERLTGESSNEIKDLSPGTYTAIAIRNFGGVAGCQIADITIEIKQIAQPPVLAELITDNTYCVGNNGKITVVAEKKETNDDDSDGYNFTWYDEEDNELANVDVTTGPFEHTLLNLAPGDYIVRVTNLKTTCFEEETYTIKDKRIVPEITDATFTHQDKCNPSGSITIEDAHVSPGNIVDYTFTWYKGGKTASDIINSAGGVGRNVLDKNTYPSMGAGTYYVTITATDGTGCTSTAYEVTIDDDSVEPTLAFEQTPNTACDLDYANGSITATATTDPTSVASDLAFIWFIVHDDGTETAFIDGTHGDLDNSVAFKSTLKNVKPGHYKVTIEDTRTGCDFTDTWEVKNKPIIPKIDTYTARDQDICDPSGSIAITNMEEGSVNDYIFTWYKEGEAAPLEKEGIVITDHFLDASNYPDMGAGTYYVTATINVAAGRGCETGRYEIIIGNKSEDPELEFDQTANTACDLDHANGTLEATATTNGNPVGAGSDFEWFVGEGTTVPYTGTVDTQDNVSTISDLKPGIYTVKITDKATGCHFTDFYTVEDVPTYPEILNATVADQDKCSPSGSITIENAHVSSGDVTDYTFTWYRGGTDASNIISGVNGHELNNVNYPTIGTDTYYVMATTVNGDGMRCETQVPFEVEIDDIIPELNIETLEYSPHTNCSVSNGEVSIEINGDTDYANYDSRYDIKWYEGDVEDAIMPAGDVIGIGNEIAGLTPNEYYTVQVVDKNTDCSTYKLFFIEDKTVLPIINPSIKDVTSCIADNGEAFAVIINKSGVYNYAWYAGHHTTVPAGASIGTTQRITNLSAGAYTVFATEQGGDQCGATAQVTIVEKQLMPDPILFTMSPLTNCDAEDPGKSNGQLSASVGGDIFNYTFEWYQGNTPVNGIPGYTGSVYSGLTSGTYTVKATNNDSGCFTYASYTVTEDQAVVQPPVLTANDRTNCEFPNGQIMATVGGNTYDYRFNWYMGNEARPNAKLNQISQLATGLDMGNYTVTVTNIYTGCTSAPVTITIGENYTYPEFDIATENSSCQQPNGLATLTVNQGLVEEIIWETPYGFERGSSMLELPAGDYSVTVISTEGCSTTKHFTIGTDINVYNGVSPNGDGKNDIFEIDCIMNFPNNNVKIFNRAGTLVFEMNGYDNETKIFEGKGNRGLYLIGNDLPDGTYFYVVEKNDGSKPKTGYLELLR